MKRYDELSQKELMEVTDEQVALLIEIEIANNGIMPVEAPIAPTIEGAGITKTELVHEVKGLYFKNEEDALAVLRMPMLQTEYDYGTGYDYKWVSPVVDAGVKKSFFYRQEDVVRCKKALQELEAKKTDYATKKGAYDKFLKVTGEIRSNVWRVVQDARNLKQEVELARKTLEKYKGLADGDETTANNFFRNTYKEREDILQMVLGE